MPRSSAVLCALALASCIPDLSGFVVVDDAGANDAGAADSGLEIDAGERDAGGAEDAGPSDAGPADAGPPPLTAIDLECPIRWTELGASPSGVCAGREVVTLAAPILVDDIAITRAIDGTLIVAFDELDGPDSARLLTVRFDEDAPSNVEDGPSIAPAATLGELVGTAIALETEAPDIHHLAYWVRSDTGNVVSHRTLRGDVLSPMQPIAIGVGPQGALDVALDSDDRAVVAWHDDATGRNAVRRELADGSWSSPVTIRMDGDPRLEGAGAVALESGSAGAMHFAFQWSISLNASSPSYSISGAADWSVPRTLDNVAASARASGVGVDLALVGDDVVVAYLDWQGGLADVRLARLRGALDPEITTRFADIPIADRPGAHPIAIATDALGLLHLVVADATGAVGSVPTATLLQYHRQIRVGGELRWIVDQIADIPREPQFVYVDLVLGPDRRPHIVYWDPALGVRYATVRP